MANDLELQLRRAERTLQQHSVDAIANRVRAIIGPSNLPELAQEAMDNLRSMVRPTPTQLAALEQVIRLMRPAPLSQAGTLDIVDAQLSAAFPAWQTFRDSIKPYLYSIGRIDSFVTDKPIGTGFLAAERLLVTNRHVLDDLSSGTYLLEKGQAVVWFGQELDTPDKEGRTDITGVVAVHDSLDIALLSIAPAANATERSPLPIETAPVTEGEAVVAIGYPYEDPVRNPIFADALFGGNYGVKRASPGEVLKVASPSLFHDCTTLGGNSGSPILSMKTARLVGLHSDGFFTYRNSAVDAGSLAQFVKQHS